MTKKSILTPELKVLNFKESLDFYTRLARFKILYDRPESDFAMLEINGANLMIEGLTEKSRAWKVGPLARPLGLGIHLQIEIPDVQASYDNFMKAGYPLFADMEEKWYRANDEELGNRQFWVQDPDGYLLRFFQDLGARSRTISS